MPQLMAHREPATLRRHPFLHQDDAAASLAVGQQTALEALSGERLDFDDVELPAQLLDRHRDRQVRLSLQDSHHDPLRGSLVGEVHARDLHRSYFRSESFSRCIRMRMVSRSGSDSCLSSRNKATCFSSSSAELGFSPTRSAIRT
jgi:hypothetical protein